MTRCMQALRLGTALLLLSMSSLLLSPATAQDTFTLTERPGVDMSLQARMGRLLSWAEQEHGANMSSVAIANLPGFGNCLVATRRLEVGETAVLLPKSGIISWPNIAASPVIGEVRMGCGWWGGKG